MVSQYSSVAIIHKYKDMIHSYAERHPIFSKDLIRYDVVNEIEGLVHFVFDKISKQANIGLKTWCGRISVREDATAIDDEMFEIVKTILKNEFDLNLEKDSGAEVISEKDYLRKGGVFLRKFETEFEKPVNVEIGDGCPIRVKPTMNAISISRPAIIHPCFDELIKAVDSSLIDQKQKMFKDTEKHIFTDVKIAVEDKIFYIHKVILTTYSDYFDCLLSDNYRESKEACITINEITKKTFESVIEFIYLQECRYLNDKSLSMKDKINQCFDLLIAADKFQLMDLFRITSVFVCDAEMLNNDSVFHILELSAKLPQCADIFEACLYYLSENIDVFTNCEVNDLSNLMDLATTIKSDTLNLIVQHAFAKKIDDPKTTQDCFDLINKIALKKRGPLLDLCLWHLKSGRFI